MAKPQNPPRVEDWEDQHNHSSCPHGLPHVVICLYCQIRWEALAIWGELLDEDTAIFG